MEDRVEVGPSRVKRLIAWLFLGALVALIAVGGRALSSSLFPNCGRYGSVSLQFAPPTSLGEVESFLKFARGSVLPGIEWSHPGPESWAATRIVKIYPKPPTDRHFEKWINSTSNSPLLVAVDRECAPIFNASGQLVRQRRPFLALALEFIYVAVLAGGAWFIGTRLG